MSKVVIAVVLAGLLTSCISSHVSSNKDPFYKGGPKSRFLFVMESGTPQDIRELETYAAEMFERKNLVAVPFTKALPPVREYTQEEMAELLRRANIEMYLRVSNSGASTAEVHIPSVSYSQGSATAYGGSGYGGATGKSATVTSGGYSKKIVTDMSFHCQVQDAVTLQTVWTGDIQIDINNRNQYVSWEDYMREIVKVLIKQLQLDGIAKM